MKKQLKLGKQPARPDAVKFKLKNFIDKKAVLNEMKKQGITLTHPKSFGNERLFTADGWGMLGNDDYGDCVFAGAAHETMVWNKMSGKDVVFTDKAVLSDYSAVTGFDPLRPYTDQGTDMEQAAAYRRKVGIVDANGVRHQIAAYLDIEQGNIEEHLIALYLFEAVGIGILFPGYAMDQFLQNKNWSYKSGTGTPNEGHYIPLVGRRSPYTKLVTWGKCISMTDAFFKHYNDQSIAYVSWEAMTNGKSQEGFDSQGLLNCLNSLK
jgi:hypothetical protein